GLPEEYGLSGGVFADFGSVWGLDNTAGTGGPADDGFSLRSSIGFSLFWETVLGPLRFNFSRALMTESYDRTRDFDFTVEARF
ncbi:MAG: BamA/TamA family outer membrane protein, partial [Octadecabacter sp.]|nr:BamA/TamA family outer membrane protein [Octadecabacter sp.]